jgi:site-specific DNA recombinase
MLSPPQQSPALWCSALPPDQFRLSGTNSTARPAFREMVASARRPAKTFDVVLVWKYSRFARSREDSIVFKTLFRKHGVQVVSITEPTEDTPTGRLMEAIIESLDEFYSANLGQEVQRGMRESASRGFCVVGITPYGYRRVKVKDGAKERSKHEIDPVRAPVVAGLFNDVLSGKGLKEIALALKNYGISGPGKKGWGVTTI